jgi:hypothetical protein
MHTSFGMTPLMKERRLKPRMPVRKVAVLYSGVQPLLCTLLDLSVSGASVSSRFSGRLGANLRLEFFLPDESVLVSTDVEVIRMEKSRGRSTIGLAFRQPTEWLTKYIELFVCDALGLSHG